MFNLLYNFLYNLVTFIVAAFFVLLGFMGMFLPWSPTVRTNLIPFLEQNSLAISLFGFGFFVIGLILWINLWLRSRRSYFYVHVGKKQILVDESILQQYIDAYWKQVFPGQEIPSFVKVKNNRIRITADLPYMPVEERKQFLEKTEMELQDLLTTVLGYSQDFVLVVSFAKKA